MAFAAAWSAALALYDVSRHRLPDALALPAGALALAACAWHPAALWGCAWPLGYLLLGRGIGGGDIKLALPLGIAVAWWAGPVGVIAAIGLSGLLSAGAAALAGAGRVAHGPAMLAAAWAVGLAGYLHG